MESAISGLIGVILGAIITVGKDWLFAKQKNKKDVQYLSALVSFELEKYASLCADVVGDNGLREGQPNEHGYSEIQVSSPKFEPLNLKVEWTALPPDLMFEILDLPYQAELAEAIINDVFANDTPPDWDDGFLERHIRYANLGIMALMLARKLQKHAKFSPRKEFECTTLTYLSERLSADEKYRFDKLSHNSLFTPS